MLKVGFLLICFCGILLLLGTFQSAVRVLANVSSPSAIAPITFPSPTQPPITFPQSTPSPKPTPTLRPTPTPSSTPPSSIRLGGLNLNDYCLSLGQAGVQLTGNNWSCRPSGAPVDFNAACRRQYNDPEAVARQLITNNPFSWQCFTGPNEFRGEYFDNQTFSGMPKVVRIDPKINFILGGGSPASGIPIDHFSIRWTRAKFMEAGKYSFTIKADDGIRFKVDNTLVINDFTSHATKTYTPDIMVKAGVHTFTIEYFENTGSAVAIFNEDFPARNRTTPSPIIIP